MPSPCHCLYHFDGFTFDNPIPRLDSTSARGKRVRCPLSPFFTKMFFFRNISTPTLRDLKHFVKVQVMYFQCFSENSLRHLDSRPIHQIHSQSRRRRRRRQQKSVVHPIWIQERDTKRRREVINPFAIATLSNCSPCIKGID
jgi:hypothetical protein